MVWADDKLGLFFFFFRHDFFLTHPSIHSYFKNLKKVYSVTLLWIIAQEQNVE